MNLYVATGYATRHRVHEFMARVIARIPDADLAYDWTRCTDKSDPYEVAQAECDGLRDADAFVALLPGGLGTASEIGFALARLIPTILVGAERGVAPAPAGWLQSPLYEFAEHARDEAGAIEYLASGVIPVRGRR